MFGEHGYAAVSMRDLAAELNIQAPSLYSHFPSKADLLLACLCPLMDEVDALLAEAPSVPVSDREVQQWLTGYIQAGARHPAATTILMTDEAARSQPKLASRVLQQARRLSAMLELFGSPDRRTTVALLGAVCLPIARDVLQPEDAGRLASKLLPLLRSTAPTTVMTSGR
jgi:AcrR family transcriptional regulator